MLLTILAVLVAFAPACSRGEEPLTLTATFADVLDLVPRAKVQTNDVPIGTVTKIALSDGNEAVVTMQVDPNTGLPAEVEAVLKQTSLLGERYVDLVAIGAAGKLGSGEIENTHTMRSAMMIV